MSIGEYEIAEVARYIDDYNTFKSFSRASMLTKRISNFHLIRMKQEFNDLTLISRISYKYIMLLCRLFGITRSKALRTCDIYYATVNRAFEFATHHLFGKDCHQGKKYIQSRQVSVIETGCDYCLNRSYCHIYWGYSSRVQVIQEINENGVHVVVAECISYSPQNFQIGVCSGDILVNKVRVVVFTKVV